MSNSVSLDKTIVGPNSLRQKTSHLVCISVTLTIQREYGPVSVIGSLQGLWLAYSPASISPQLTIAIDYNGELACR